MQEFKQHTGLAAPLDAANVDTDQIIPKQFLQKVSKLGFGKHLFHDWRFLDEAGEQPNPEFVLNAPRYQGASILLACSRLEPFPKFSRASRMLAPM